jgi:hypothetical protein
MEAMKALSTTKTKPKASKASKPAAHRHRCPVCTDFWTHNERCENHKVMTKICPDCEAKNPRKASNGTSAPEPSTIS